MKKYQFQGPVQSGVTFGRGKNARDVQLIPGRIVELDPENPWVKSSVAKRHLVPVADSVTADAPNVRTATNAGELPGVNTTPGDKNEAPKDGGSALSTTLGDVTKNKRKG